MESYPKARGDLDFEMHLVDSVTSRRQAMFTSRTCVFGIETDGLHDASMWSGTLTQGFFE